MVLELVTVPDDTCSFEAMPFTASAVPTLFRTERSERTADTTTQKIACRYRQAIRNTQGPGVGRLSLLRAKCPLAVIVGA